MDEPCIPPVLRPSLPDVNAFGVVAIGTLNQKPTRQQSLAIFDCLGEALLNGVAHNLYTNLKYLNFGKHTF